MGCNFFFLSLSLSHSSCKLIAEIPLELLVYTKEFVPLFFPTDREGVFSSSGCESLDGREGKGGGTNVTLSHATQCNAGELSGSVPEQRVLSVLLSGRENKQCVNPLAECSGGRVHVWQQVIRGLLHFS